MFSMVDGESSYRSSHLTKGPEYQQKFEINSFRRIAWEWERGVLSAIASDLSDERRGSYLDVACGTGRILSSLEHLFRESIGVDISSSMLEVAKERVKVAILLNCDFTKPMPAFERRFDLITGFRFFANAEPLLRDSAIRSIGRMLKPGGLLVVNNHKNSRSAAFRTLSIRSTIKTGRKVIEGFSTKELIKLCATAGLRHIDTHSWGVIPSAESRMLLPERLYGAMENLLSKNKILGDYAQYQICVFRYAPFG